MPNSSGYRTTGRPNYRAEQRSAAARGTHERPLPPWERENDLYPPDWPAISAAIKQRDGYRCQWHKLKPGAPRCPAYFPPPFSHYLHVHHVIPLPRGSNKPSNLLTLCVDCHGKTHGRKLGAISERARRAAARW